MSRLLFAAFLFFAACTAEEAPIQGTYVPVDCVCPEPEPAPACESVVGAEPVERDLEPEPAVSVSQAEVSKPTAAKEAAKKAATKKVAPETPLPPPLLDRRIDLNTASKAELETLPRVGPSTAQRILDYRAKRPFKREKDLMRIKGIGPRTFEKLREKVVVR